MKLTVSLMYIIGNITVNLPFIMAGVMESKGNYSDEKGVEVAAPREL